MQIISSSIVVAFLVGLAICQENEDTFMCRKVGRDSHSYGTATGEQVEIKTGTAKPGEETRAREDDVIDIMLERIRVLERRVSMLERERNMPSPRADPGNLFDTTGTPIPPEETTPTPMIPESSDHCQIYHRERCFTFVSKKLGAIGLKEAQTKCRALNGELANVYDEDHFAKIEDYLLQNTEDDGGKEFFIVGMTYNVKKNTVSLRGGVRAHFVKWYSDDYPNTRSRYNTRIHIQVNHSAGNGNDGMYNVSPTARAKSALCEIHPRHL